jgi:hypothetical protein
MVELYISTKLMETASRVKYILRTNSLNDIEKIYKQKRIVWIEINYIDKYEI